MKEETRDKDRWENKAMEKVSKMHCAFHLLCYHQHHLPEEEGARDGPPSFPHQLEHQIFVDLPRKPLIQYNNHGNHI
jgi:hypothetical protein